MTFDLLFRGSSRHSYRRIETETSVVEPHFANFILVDDFIHFDFDFWLCVSS
jgi:hypothetical protein